MQVLGRHLQLGVLCTVWFSVTVFAQATAPRKSPVRKQRDRTFKVLAQLHTEIPQIAFDNEPLEDVFDQLRQLGLKNILIHWQRIDNVGTADRGTPVTLDLERVTLHEVLQLTLEYASQMAAMPADELTYQIDNGIVVVSTRDYFGGRLYTRAYDVEALLQPLVFYADAPTISLSGSGTGSNASSGSGAGGTASSGSSGGGIFEGSQGSSGQHGGGASTDFGQNREDQIEALVNMIKSLRPTTWYGQGGQGTITTYDGRLVITQTVEMHEMIGGTFVKQRAHQPVRRP